MPPAAVMPIAIAIFGLSPEMSLVVVIFGAIWPALFATVHGFSSVEPRLKEVGQALTLSPLAFIWKIALPNATPDIIAGMQLSLVVSLVLVVITDMITGQPGLGSLVVLASRTFDMAGLFAGLVLLSLIGLISNAAIVAVKRRHADHGSRRPGTRPWNPRQGGPGTRSFLAAAEAVWAFAPRANAKAASAAAKRMDCKGSAFARGSRGQRPPGA